MLPSDPGTLSHDPNATAAPTPPADGVGLPVIPGYDVLSVLGRGAMGVVYRARHHALNRPVALKMVLAGVHADPEHLVRFLHEAELMARVRHPGVVTIHEVGRHDGLPYFALEFCSGGTLAARLAGAPLPPREAARLAATLARAVQAAHECGVIHRDLKPGNVLLADDGSPKLADFGLARFADLAGHLTATGAVMGTPAYMAPEQAAGAKGVGPLADVYSLGAMLYCFLTGRPPHQAATHFETLHQVLADDPVPPRSLQPGLPRDLETIAMKALHKLPERRYASAAQLAADLDRWLADEPIFARPTGPLERAAKWAKRRPAATLAVGGTVGLTAFVLFLAAFDARLNTKQSELDAALIEQGQGKVELAAKQTVLDDGQRAARVTKSQLDLLTSQTYWERGNAALARQTLDAVAVEDRHWEWHYLKRAYDPGESVAPVRALDHRRVVAPDRRRAAEIMTDSVVIHDATSQSLVTLRGHTDWLHSAAWSPDGERLVTTSNDRTARVWDATTGRELAVFRGHTSGVMRPAWSPDGRRVATGSRDATVRVWDAATGGELVVLRGHSQAVQAVSWSPDGRRLATASNDDTVRVWNTVSSGDVVVLKNLKRDAAVSWSHDGRRVHVDADGRRRTADLAFGLMVGLTDLDPGERPYAPRDPRRMALRSPNGQYELVVERQAATPAEREPDALSITVREVATGRLSRGPTNVGRVLAWRPDGRAFTTTSSDNIIRGWDVAAGGEAFVLSGHTRSIASAAWSPDGRRLVTASRDGSARVWDPTTQRELIAFHNPTTWMMTAAWSPDGRRIVARDENPDPDAAPNTFGIRLLDGSPAGHPARDRFERLMRSLPRPDWNRGEAQAAVASGSLAAAHFHISQAVPNAPLRWLRRAQYALAAAAAVESGEYRSVGPLVLASLRPPGRALDYRLMQVAIHEAHDGPAAAVGHWRQLARISARQLARNDQAAERDHLHLAHLQRLASDDRAADATLAASARRWSQPLVGRCIAGGIAAGAGVADLRLTAALSFPLALNGRTHFDDYAIHNAGPVSAQLYPWVDDTDLARLRTGRSDTLLATVGRFRTSSRAYFCAAIAHATNGDAGAAKVAVTKADVGLLVYAEDLAGNMILRREALARIAAIERAKPDDKPPSSAVAPR